MGRVSFAIFSTISTFLHLRSQIFAHPQGHLWVLRGPEGKVEEGGSGFSPERGQISREVSGNVFSSEGSDFQENF